MGTFGADANGEATSGMNHEGESTNAAPRGGTPRSSDEAGESRRSEGGVCSEATSIGPTRKGRSPKDEAKPFCISRWEVWEAYLRVKSNQGAAGLDGQSIEEFGRDLKKNLYRIWNRMSSGSYFPPPVRTVKIPKANGGERTLGIPTVSDRIAQMVVKNRRKQWWIHYSCRHRMGIARRSRRWMRWGRLDKCAGPTTGFATWTSRAWSTISITI